MISELKKHLGEIVMYIESCGVNLHPYPKVKLDVTQVSKPYIFMPTGNYDVNTQTITLFVNSRHPKDILRTFSHELIHHNQFLEGKMKYSNNENTSDLKYAQNDKNLRKLEIEAYAKGNILFRDWADNKTYPS